MEFIRKIVPKNIKNYLWHFPKAVLANIIYGFPARKIKVIGVAGTKGKTTTTYLISQLLESYGKKTALLSTAVIKIGDQEKLNDLKMTSPSSFYIQKFLKKTLKEGCDYLVLETSSHALKQFRTWGIEFEAVVITNLIPDHLEYHKTKEDYILTHKKMISNKTKILVLNNDDEYSKDFKNLNTPKILIGEKATSDFKIENYSLLENGSRIAFSYKNQEYNCFLPLIGKFNVYNFLSAVACLKGLDFQIAKISEKSLKLKPAPGRVEVVYDNDFKIIVDYAHSPESFESLFLALKPFVKGKLIAVTGACGERDRNKRPKMGELLAFYSDLVVITNDDPYGEDPEQIAQDLISGLVKSNKFQETKNFWKILDRREGIKKGIELANNNDVVVILGKGPEQWQVFKNYKIPWDDRKIAKEIVEAKNK